MITRGDSIYYTNGGGYVFRKRDAVGQRTFAPEQLFWKNRPVLAGASDAELAEVVDDYLQKNA